MPHTALQTASSEDSARNQILESAIHIFSTQGFGGARLREIADHAGVNHAMIKYYFGNKEQLWKDAVTFLFQRQADETIATYPMIDKHDPRKAMHQSIESLIRYNARHPEHARLVMLASMTPGPHLNWVLDQMVAYNPVNLGHFLGDAATAKPNLFTMSMRYLIYGASHTIFTLEHEVKQLYGVDVADPGFIDFFVSLAMQQLSPALDALCAEMFDLPPDDATTQDTQPRLSTIETDEGMELRILIPKAPAS